MRTMKYYKKEEILETHYKGKEKKIQLYNSDCSVAASDLYFGKFFTPRYLTAGQKIYFDKEMNSVILIAKPFITEGLEFSKTSQIEMMTTPNDKTPKMVKAYPLFNWIFNYYQQIDDGITLFTQVTNVDFLFSFFIFLRSI